MPVHALHFQGSIFSRALAGVDDTVSAAGNVHDMLHPGLGLASRFDSLM